MKRHDRAITDWAESVEKANKILARKLAGFDSPALDIARSIGAAIGIYRSRAELSSVHVEHATAARLSKAELPSGPERLLLAESIVTDEAEKYFAVADQRAPMRSNEPAAKAAVAAVCARLATFVDERFTALSSEEKARSAMDAMLRYKRGKDGRLGPRKLTVVLNEIAGGPLDSRGGLSKDSIKAARRRARR